MKKSPITFAQIKVALAIDLAKMHKKELVQLTRAKTLKALRGTVAFYDTISTKTNRLVDKFANQEDSK